MRTLAPRQMGSFGSTAPAPASPGRSLLPPGGRIGDDVPVDQMTTLRRVIVVGLLEGNPTPPALAEDRDAVDPNGGWKSATSDNAALWGIRSMTPATPPWSTEPW